MAGDRFGPSGSAWAGGIFAAIMIHGALYEGWEPFTYKGAMRLVFTALMFIVTYQLGRESAKRH